MQGTKQVAGSGVFDANCNKIPYVPNIFEQIPQSTRRTSWSRCFHHPWTEFFCWGVCDSTSRTGSASLALHFKLSGKCCSRGIRRSFALAPSVGQDWYVTACAFLR